MRMTGKTKPWACLGLNLFVLALEGLTFSEENHCNSKSTSIHCNLGPLNTGHSSVIHPIPQ